MDARYGDESGRAVRIIGVNEWWGTIFNPELIIIIGWNRSVIPLFFSKFRFTFTHRVKLCLETPRLSILSPLELINQPTS